MNNIETKMNMLYDFIYSKSFKSNVKEIDIDENNISMDDIKIKKHGDNYDDILAELFSGKFKQVDFIEQIKTLILKRYSDSLSLCLYISPYIDEEDAEALDNMNNNDALFSYILSRLVLSKKTKHIALPIINVDINFHQMSDIMKSYSDIYEGYKEMIEKQLISKLFSVRVKENFFKSISLRELLNGEFNMKKLLFQIIHTLAILQKAYPGFRHNMLNPSNIFVYLKKQTDSVDTYEFNGDVYYLSNNTFEIKITNFIAASIPEQYSANVDPELNIPFLKEGGNDYFDLHYLLNNIISMMKLDTLDENTKEFLDKVIPEKYRKSSDLYMSKFVELHKPSDLLKDDYFKEYNKKVKVEETMSSNDYYTGKKSSKGSRKLNMKGGAEFFKPPIVKVRNDPFVSNENRRIYKTDMDSKDQIKRTYVPNEKIEPKEREYIKKQTTKVEEPKPTKQPQVIAKQELVVNPDYIRPPPKKERPSWDPEYKPKPKYDKVPQATPFYEPEKKETSEESYDSDDSDDSDKSDKSNKSNKSDKSDDITIESDESKPYHKPHYEKSHRYDKPYYDKSQRYDKPYHDKPYIKPQGDKYYKQTEQKSITDYPVLAEQKLYNVPPQMSMPPGTMHTHPKYSNPAWIPTDNQIMYPPAFVPDMPNYFPFNGIPLKKPNEIPLQKIYNINLANPGQQNNMLNKIYQDVLPGDPYVYTMASVFERRQLISMMRTSMIKNNGIYSYC